MKSFIAAAVILITVILAVDLSYNGGKIIGAIGYYIVGGSVIRP